MCRGVVDKDPVRLLSVITERLAMICYQVPDIRLFTENNISFLKQFAI
jgi:O-phosphoseryl-tRNA(Cys) synthetase